MITELPLTESGVVLRPLIQSLSLFDRGTPPLFAALSVADWSVIPLDRRVGHQWAELREHRYDRRAMWGATAGNITIMMMIIIFVVGIGILFLQGGRFVGGRT